MGGGGGRVCCGHGDPVVDMCLPGSCHRRAAVPGCCCWKRMLETTPRVIVAGDSGVPAQLRRGRRKRGNVCAVFIVCFEGCRCWGWERFGLWDVVTGRGHAASKAGPASNPVPTCKTARQLPSPWAVTTPHAGALMQALAQPHCGSPAQPRPTGPHRAPTHKFSPKFSGFLLFSSFLILNNAKKPHSRNCFLVGWEVRCASSRGGVSLWPTIMPMRFSNGMENEHQRTILGAAAPLLCPMGVAAMIERTDDHALYL